jgi:hypothetical protein
VHNPLLNLQANRLIKAEQQHRAKARDFSEASRTGPVLDNRTFMDSRGLQPQQIDRLPFVSRLHGGATIL